MKGFWPKKFDFFLSEAFQKKLKNTYSYSARRALFNQILTLSILTYLICVFFAFCMASRRCHAGLKGLNTICVNSLLFITIWNTVTKIIFNSFKSEKFLLIQINNVPGNQNVDCPSYHSRLIWNNHWNKVQVTRVWGFAQLFLVEILFLDH